MNALRHFILDSLHKIEWLPLLAVRLLFGYFWLETGWAKLHNLDGFAARFVEWGIPLPAFSAALCAGTEFLGGALIMLGLFTRLTMIPMIVNMIVAILVVVIHDVSSLDEFVELDEALYVAVFFWLLVSGPGVVSVDSLIGRRLDARAGIQ
jgi:putative oxidoreductase